MRLLERALDVLEYVCANGGTDVAGISSALGIPVSTVYRTLSALEQRDYVRHSAPNCYEVGARLLTLHGITELQNKLMQVSRLHLQQLSRRTGQTAHLAVLSTNQVGYIDTVIGPTGLSVYPSLGSSSPLYCTSLGKALLAFLPARLQDSILSQLNLEPHTHNTLTSLTQVREHLAQVRQQGYAVDDEEFQLGVRCIGAPVRSAAGEVIAAISISGLAAQVGGESFESLVEAVRETASAISSELGYEAFEHWPKKNRAESESSTS